MAKSLRAGRFANPESIHGIHPHLLRRLLEPYRPCLEPLGVFTPDGDIDLDAVARVFADLGPDVPDSLVDRLSVIDEMARPANFDALLAEANRLGLDVGEEPTPADLVVTLLLDAAVALERIYAEQLPSARRKFRSHLALTDNPPDVHEIPEHVAESLRAVLDSDFAYRKRGRGVRVYPVATESGFRMIIRRGDVLQREATVDPVTGEAHNIAFRPQRFDMVIYKADEGEMLVNARSDADVRAYLEHIGHHVFGMAGLFLGEGLPARYTLDPIVALGEGCLVVGDVPELDGARLTAIEWSHGNSVGMSTRKRSGDVFRALDMAGERIPRGATLINATFRVRFLDGRETVVRIVPPNDAVLGREGDAEVILRWLALRGFLQERRIATIGLTRVLLATT